MTVGWFALILSFIFRGRRCKEDCGVCHWHFDRFDQEPCEEEDFVFGAGPLLCGGGGGGGGHEATTPAARLPMTFFAPGGRLQQPGEPPPAGDEPVVVDFVWNAEDRATHRLAAETWNVLLLENSTFSDLPSPAINETACNTQLQLCLRFLGPMQTLTSSNAPLVVVVDDGHHRVARAQRPRHSLLITKEFAGSRYRAHLATRNVSCAAVRRKYGDFAAVFRVNAYCSFGRAYQWPRWIHADVLSVLALSTRATEEQQRTRTVFLSYASKSWASPWTESPDKLGRAAAVLAAQRFCSDSGRSCQLSNWVPYSPAGYVDLMRRSLAVLVPPGLFPSTYRVWEAMAAGAVAVVWVDDERHWAAFADLIELDAPIVWVRNASHLAAELADAPRLRRLQALVVPFFHRKMVPAYQNLFRWMVTQ